MQERFLKGKESFTGKVMSTHLFPNNKHYSFSVSEKTIDGLYRNTKAPMTDGDDVLRWASFTFLTLKF
jgi:hypothetical protein